MFFVLEYTYPGRLAMGLVAMALGGSAAVLVRRVPSRARFLGIPLGVLGILLSVRVVALCGFMALFFGFGGSR